MKGKYQTIIEKYGIEVATFYQFLSSSVHHLDTLSRYKNRG